MTSLLQDVKIFSGKVLTSAKKRAYGRQRVYFLKGLWPRLLVPSFITTACSLKILVNLSLEFLIKLSAEFFNKLLYALRNENKVLELNKGFEDCRS